MTAQDARQGLIQQIEGEAKREAMVLVRDLEAQAREEADKRARKIIAIAMQRVASELTTEATVTTLTLPNEDMKGRIIGREGRNIRAFEAATGSNLIIDDTPEAVVLSCFDPIRREAARLTLEKLIGDGRIQPARIEEMHLKSVKEVEREIRVGVMPADTDAPHGLAVSPDGKTIASASWDRTIRLWPVEGGENRVLEGHDQNVNGVAFSRDGQQLVRIPVKTCQDLISVEDQREQSL
jgi:WD40 repeat protein